MNTELPSHCFTSGEPYREYMELSKSMNDKTIIDIGSYRGFSAFALAANKSNKVHSFDIANYLEINFPDNVVFKEQGGMSIPKALIKKASVILLDVDPHDGLKEIEMYNYIKECGFKGTLILDDIFLNEGMKAFYESIDLPKHFTFWHHSGTGFVNFQ